MEAFSQKTRDALYGRYFLYATSGNEPDLLRVINFTATGVQFGRVPMQVLKCGENAFTSTPDYSSELLPVAGAKLVNVAHDAVSEQFSYVDTKSNKTYRVCTAPPTQGFPWSVAESKTRKAAAPKAKTKAKAKQETEETTAVDEPASTTGKHKPSAVQNPPKAKKTKNAQPVAEDEEEEEEEEEEDKLPMKTTTPLPPPPPLPAVTKKPLSSVLKTAVVAPKPKAPEVKPAKDKKKAPRDSPIHRPRTPEPMAIDDIIDQSAPEIGEFLDDLRDEDHDT